MNMQETDTHAIEYEGGWLFITEKETGRDYPVRLLNNRGQCITRGQFQDAASKFGIDRACATFKKLAAKAA